MGKKMKIALVAVGILSSCMMFAQATDSIVKSLKPNLLSVKLEEWQQNAKMAEGIVSPDGSTKSVRLSRKTSGDNESQLRTGDFEVKPNVVYTLSVYAKAGTPGTKLNLRFIAAEKPDSKPADTYVAFNLENGTVSYSGTLFKAAIEPKGNGWYLCSITGTALDGPNKLIDIQVTSKGVCGGNEDDFIYVWNARLEGEGIAPVRARPVFNKPSILFLTYWAPPADMKRNMQRLDKLGYRIACHTFKELAQKSEETINQFDVVVVLEQHYDGMEGVLGEKGFNKAIEKLHEKLRGFMKNGGGVLLFPCNIMQDQRIMDALAGNYGVTFLSGGHFDKVASKDELGIEYAYTSEIAKDPRTQGVTGFWYPVNPDMNWPNAHTTAFDVDAKWMILASGRDTTKFKAIEDGKLIKFAQQPRFLTLTKERAPILAAREGVEGKGRLAICGVDSAYTDFMAGNTALNGVCTGAGLEGKKSDLDRLLMNIVDWLGESSMKEKRVTIELSEKATFATPPFKYADPMVVGKDRSFRPTPDQYVGLVGARSVFSGGKSTVAEYAASARELGLQYLVFLEDFETLKEAEFEQFKKECEANSDDKLILIPGIRIRTEKGVNFFGFCVGLKLPKPAYIKPGTRLLKQYPDNGSLAWNVDHGGRNLACGNFRLEEKMPSGIPPENYNLCNPFVSLYTYRYGKLMDSMMEAYLKCAARTEIVSPITINLVDSAEELRTEWKSDHFKTIYLREQGQGLNGFKQELGERYAASPASYVSSGPKIEEWRSSGWSHDGSFWDWTRYRWFVRMAVSSEAGLKEIVVMNGTKPMYRFLPQGAKRFEQELVLTHNDMHNLILIVTDNNGHQAVSDEEWDKNHLLQLTWCSDRNNMLSYSCLPAPKASSGNTGGNYPTPWNLEKGGFRENLLPAVNMDRTSLPHFDGQPMKMAIVSVGPSVKNENVYRIARDIGRDLSSPDAAIQTAACRLVYDESVKVSPPGDMGPLVPMSLFNADLRYITFSHAGHQAAPVILEGTLKILKDIIFSKDERMGIGILNMYASDPGSGYHTMAIQHSKTGNMLFSLKDKNVSGSNGAFNHGAYIYVYPSRYGSAGLFSLTDDLIYNCDNNGRVAIGFDTAGKTFTAGTELKYRIIAMVSGFDELHSTQLPERFRTMMGLAEKGKTAYSVTVEQGKILDTDYILRIDGSGTGFAGEIILPAETPIPVSVPIVVENLNDRWTSVLYDREGKRFRPLGMHDGKTYCHRALDERKGKIFIGHPFTIDNKELRLSVVQTQANELTLQVQNPTDKAVTATVNRTPVFDFVTTSPFAVTVAAGGMVEYRLIGEKAEFVK